MKVGANEMKWNENGCKGLKISNSIHLPTTLEAVMFALLHLSIYLCISSFRLGQHPPLSQDLFGKIQDRETTKCEDTPLLGSAL